MDPRTLADRAVANLDPDIVTAISSDPKLGAAKLGLSVEAMEAVPKRGSGGWCDGASFVDDGRIMYRPTLSLRENFTICHELAHHLLRLDDDAMDWVYDRDDPNDALETLCDKMAAALLVPSDLVDQMPSLGFVAVIDPSNQRVWVTARKGDTSPAAYRDQVIPPGHILHRLTDENDHIRAKSWWPRGANDRWSYYLDACRAGNWNIAVFAERDLLEIEELHFAAPERIQHDGDVNCPCGFKGGSKWFPCNDCKAPSCPKCRKCLCDYRAERENRTACTQCFQSVGAHLLEDGVCDGCR